MDSATRRWWSYSRAVAMGGILGYLLVLGLARHYVPDRILARTFTARFEWDSTHGVKTFRLEGSVLGDRVGGWAWRYLVAAQIRPRLDSYLRHGQMQRASGWALVSVARVIPIAVPDSWGSDRLDFKDPNEPPLILAASRGDIEAVRKLIGEGVDVNARDQWDATALLSACTHAYSASSADVVRALLEAGTDPNVGNRWGAVPLVSAVLTASARNRAAIIRELLRAHADVNARSGSGDTALANAASIGEAETVRILLEAGADPNQPSGGATPLTWARRGGRARVIGLLEQAGARGE